MVSSLKLAVCPEYSRDKVAVMNNKHIVRCSDEDDDDKPTETHAASHLIADKTQGTKWHESYSNLIDTGGKTNLTVFYSADMTETKMTKVRYCRHFKTHPSLIKFYKVNTTALVGELGPADYELLRQHKLAALDYRVLATHPATRDSASVQTLLLDETLSVEYVELKTQPICAIRESAMVISNNHHTPYNCLSEFEQAIVAKIF